MRGAHAPMRAQAGVIMTFIMIGQDSKIISRYSGQPYTMFESGVW